MKVSLHNTKSDLCSQFQQNKFYSVDPDRISEFYRFDLDRFSSIQKLKKLHTHQHPDHSGPEIRIQKLVKTFYDKTDLLLNTF